MKDIEQKFQVAVDRIEALEDAYSMLAKECSGFIKAHELAIRGDGGNSNIACMEHRLKQAKNMVPFKLEKLTTEF